MKTPDLSYVTDGLLAMMQAKYAEAFAKNDREAMLKRAQHLYQGYAAVGNKALAKKWTDEYIRCWVDGGWTPPPDEEPPIAPEPPVRMPSEARTIYS